jgi:Uncharacterized conserved protein
MKSYCLTLDLKNDPQLITEYEQYHQQVWPEVKKSIFDSGILSMEIYRFQNRLCMIIETNDDFSFERKAEMDSQNIKVQEWETTMLKFQQLIPGTEASAKWVEMKKIFSLNN